MNPDQQQPQNASEPLPEVPKIEATPPLSPTTPPTTPEPVPQSTVVPVPEPAAVPVQSAEPLVEATAAPLETPGQPVVAQPAEPASVAGPSIPVEAQPITSTTSVSTTPNPSFPQIDLSAAPATVVLVPPKKKKLGLVIGLIVGGVVLLGAVAAVLYFFVFASGKVADTDLVTSTTDGTSYLRPKQWQSVTVDSVSGYGDKKGQNDTSTAAIFVKKLSYVQSGVKSITTKELADFRDSILQSMTLSSGGDIAKETGSCTSTEDVTVKKSTVATTNMVGIIRIDATCKRDDGTFKIAIYYTLGEDGYRRSIVLMATESLWKQNETVFNKMLDSADQN